MLKKVVKGVSCIAFDVTWRIQVDEQPDVAELPLVMLQVKKFTVRPVLILAVHRQQLNAV
jgi:hypothetical protein